MATVDDAPLTKEASAQVDAVFARVEDLVSWIPKCDPTSPEAQTFEIKQKRRSGLLLTALLIAALVLLVNAVSLCILFWSPSFTHKDGLVELYFGSCGVTKSLNVGLHVLINFLSTCLLGASNLCMQLITAPTRKQIDQAHTKENDYYDIGVLSLRNFFKASWGSKITCLILLASSLPLHFIYNSAVSTTVAQFAYPAFVVTESFLDGAPAGDSYVRSTALDPAYLTTMRKFVHDRTKYLKLSNHECLTRFSSQFNPTSNLFVVVEDSEDTKNQSLLEYKEIGAGSGSGQTFDSQTWICSSSAANSSEGRQVSANAWSMSGPQCYYPQDFSDKAIANWYKYGHKVEYCLALRNDGDYCSVQYWPIIALVICLTNMIKCGCIAVCLLQSRRNEKHSSTATLCTIGDAIASFLQEPEIPGSADEFTLREQARWIQSAYQPRGQKPMRWYQTISKTRIISTALLCNIILIAAIVQLVLRIKSIMDFLGIRNTPSEVLSGVGFGSVDPMALTFISGMARHGIAGFVSSVLYANYWQFLVSIIYTASNALLTSFHVSHEWSGLALRRNFLRVSHPEGMQRSTYFISLPWRYGLPLSLASTILHTLVSQSIFVVNSKTYASSYGDYTTDLADYGGSYITTTTNCQGILVSICFAASLFTSIGCLGFFKRLRSNMPVVSSDSRAIHYHCRRPWQDTDAHLLPVKWGRIPPDVSPFKEGHCAITTLKDVQPPDGVISTREEVASSKIWRRRKQGVKAKCSSQVKKSGKWLLKIFQIMISSVWGD